MAPKNGRSRTKGEKKKKEEKGKSIYTYISLLSLVFFLSNLKTMVLIT